MFPLSLQSIISNQMRPRRLRRAWFSRLLRQPARRWSGSTLSPGTHTGLEDHCYSTSSCGNPIAEAFSQLRHALSRDFTVLPAHSRSAPAFAFPSEAVPRLPTTQRWKVELAGYTPWWLARLQRVTHPSTNRARCWLTSWTKANALTHYTTLSR